MTATTNRCGTESGYRRHRRQGEKPCADCRSAHARACAERDFRAGRRSSPEPQRRPLQPCGTTAAYQRHLKRGEQPCEPCAEAARVRSRTDQRRYRQDPVKRARFAEKERLRRRVAGIQPQQAMQHGTAHARSWHYRRGERLCLECALSLTRWTNMKGLTCGTAEAAKRHRERGETCETCRVNGKPGRTGFREHGTEAALRVHEYHHETPCDPCREVQRQKTRDKRARAKARAIAEGRLPAAPRAKARKRTKAERKRDAVARDLAARMAVGLMSSS